MRVICPHFLEGNLVVHMSSGFCKVYQTFRKCCSSEGSGSDVLFWVLIFVCVYMKHCG